MNAYELADMVEKEPFHTNLNRNTIALFIRQQANRIAELEDKLSFYEIKDLDSGLKTKPLSDEEIYELWCEADNTELLPEMRMKDGSINYIITTFARAIEERHGIK